MKKALIVTNLIGFIHFLWNDILTLQSLGYAVTVASNHDAEDAGDVADVERLESMGVTFFHLDWSSKSPLSKQNLYAYRGISRILERGEFELVHCHTPIAGCITRLAAAKYRLRGTKVLYTSHGFAFTCYSSKKQRCVYYTIEKIVSIFTDTIITINQDDYEKARKFWCKDIRKINGVGVDTAKYHDVVLNVDEYKEKLGLPRDKIMLLSVGELSERKNHQVIVKALGLLPDKEKYIYVICGREIGGNTITNNLKQLAQENDVALYLLGHRSDIPQIMHCSDIGAIPSVREGLGLAGVQSLCAEVPLVGTNVQGIKEYIIDGVTGYLCEPFDAQGYAGAIKKLTDLENRERMKKNCYEIARRFDNRVSHRQMTEIYCGYATGK